MPKSSFTLACRVIQWRGQKVSIICVGRVGRGAQVFVVDRKVVCDSGDIEQKRLAQSSGYPVVAWEDAAYANVMVGHTPDTRLSKVAANHGGAIRPS